MDAVRLLPLLGLALWMVPLLWVTPDATQPGAALSGALRVEGAIPMSSALRYVFGIWVLLIIAGVALSRSLADRDPLSDPDTSDGPP